MEDNLNGSRPQWKTTSMEDDLNGRRSQRKTTGYSVSPQFAGMITHALPLSAGRQSQLSWLNKNLLNYLLPNKIENYST